MSYLNLKEWRLESDDVENLRMLLLNKRATYECEFATYILHTIKFEIQSGPIVKFLLEKLVEIRSIQIKDIMN